VQRVREREGEAGYISAAERREKKNAYDWGIFILAWR